MSSGVSSPSRCQCLCLGECSLPYYPVMIIERNAVINTVTGTVTGQSGVKVQRSASTGWTLDCWDEIMHESSQRRGRPSVQPEQRYTWQQAHDMRQLQWKTQGHWHYENAGEIRITAPDRRLGRISETKTGQLLGLLVYTEKVARL